MQFHFAGVCGIICKRLPCSLCLTASDGRKFARFNWDVSFRMLLQTGVLGEGTFGVVLRARDPQAMGGGEIAIKLLPRGDFVSVHCAAAS